jgi:predicted amidohydrolase YtcJ
MPLATYIKRGIRFTSSSDYFVTPLPARYGMWAAVTREPIKSTFGAHPFGTRRPSMSTTGCAGSHAEPEIGRSK